MYEISKKEWDKISNDFKGEWSEPIVKYCNLNKSYIGKKTVLEGCLTGLPGTTLLTEGIHFVIKNS